MTYLKKPSIFKQFEKYTNGVSPKINNPQNYFKVTDCRRYVKNTEKKVQKIFGNPVRVFIY